MRCARHSLHDFIAGSDPDDRPVLAMLTDQTQQLPVVERHRAQRRPEVDPLFRAKAPLRVSFAGGGTDVAPFPATEGGCVLSATINRFAHGLLRPRSDRRIHVESLDLRTAIGFSADEPTQFDGQLDLVKAAIRRIAELDVARGFDVFLETAAPPGSGLGASSALIVALIGVLVDQHGLSLTATRWLSWPMRSNGSISGSRAGCRITTRRRSAGLTSSSSTAIASWSIR